MDAHEQPSAPDAPDQEAMEQIRRRRVAKLGANPAEPAASTTTTTTTTTTKPPDTDTAPTEPVPTAPAPPESTVPPSSEKHEGRKRRASTDTDLGPVTVTSAAPRRHVGPVKEESIEDWADKTLNHIFRITVDPGREEDTHGHKLTFLPEMSQDALDADALPKLSVENLDQALIEMGTAWPHDRPLLDYLLPCWKRVVRQIRTLRSPAPQKEAMLKEARRLCFSNCILGLTTPELFGRSPDLFPSHESLMPFVLRSLESDVGLDLDFYSEAVARLDEDDSIEPLFVKALADLSAKLATMTMNDDYKPYVAALTTYSKFPPLLNAVARHPCFHMAQSAPGIEKHTILGPFFRLSPLQADVAKLYFASPKTMDKGRIQSAQSALQITLVAHQADLRSIVDSLIRASTETRNKVLDWFAHVMNVNHKRRAIQVDPTEVSSDGFMINVTVVLDYLCEPFMDTTFSKIDRIDVDYFRRSPRLDIRDETKINADQHQSDAYYAVKVDGPSNFITEVFFLTLAAHHYGAEAANAKLKSLDREIKHFEKQLALLESERQKVLHSPAQLAQYDTALKKYKDLVDRYIATRHTLEGILVDQKMQGRAVQFMRYVSVWLLRVASRTPYTPDKPLKLPLPESQPDAFSCLPEYALQDVVETFKFVFRYVPQTIVSAVGDEVIALCLTFLESSEYIRNPYLKSSLVSLLYSGTWPLFHLARGVLGDLLTSTRFANDYLLHAVMKFYIECESTGAHTQFYDKFNIRFEIFHVIKCVWTNDLYKEQLTQASKTDRSFFVRFVNMLMNDATYVLDEGLSKFPKIKELTEALRDQHLPQPERQKKEEELQAAEGQAQSYMQLANETVAMMKLFTSALSEAFTMPEIVTRLAGMLDYNLDILTGPKSRHLVVANPEKYHFNPKTLMPELVDIYLNLGASPAFIDAVAADGRSYKPETFSSTTRILQSRYLKSEPDLRRWEALCRRFADAKERFDQAEMDFGDVPPEFEDPIMGDLMKDPVLLPSKHVVDRSTIVQHLLSDQKDPFTRQPMTIDDAVPDDALRHRIEQWKAERKAEAQAKAAGGAAAGDGAGDAMDTTE